MTTETNGYQQALESLRSRTSSIRDVRVDQRCGQRLAVPDLDGQR